MTSLSMRTKFHHAAKCNQKKAACKTPKKCIPNNTTLVNRKHNYEECLVHGCKWLYINMSDHIKKQKYLNIETFKKKNCIFFSHHKTSRAWILLLGLEVPCRNRLASTAYLAIVSSVFCMQHQNNLFFQKWLN